MSVWRCPRCGAVTALEARFGEIVSVYDLCTPGADARAGRSPTRMEPLAAEDGTEGTRERELVNSSV